MRIRGSGRRQSPPRLQQQARLRLPRRVAALYLTRATPRAVRTSALSARSLLERSLWSTATPRGRDELDVGGGIGLDARCERRAIPQSPPAAGDSSFPFHVLERLRRSRRTGIAGSRRIVSTKVLYLVDWDREPDCVRLRQLGVDDADNDALAVHDRAAAVAGVHAVRDLQDRRSPWVAPPKCRRQPRGSRSSTLGT